MSEENPNTRLGRVVSYAVPCQQCGHRTPKTIAWLSVNNEMPCNHCGSVIDLKAGYVAFVIQELAQQCRDVGVRARGV